VCEPGTAMGRRGARAPSATRWSGRLLDKAGLGKDGATVAVATAEQDSEQRPRAWLTAGVVNSCA